MTKRSKLTYSTDSAARITSDPATKEIREEPAHCIVDGCIMTMGFGIGGGAHICWLHRLVAPKVDKMLKKCGAREVGLSPNFRSKPCTDEIPSGVGGARKSENV